VKLTGQTACQPAATACAKGQYANSAAACASCGAGQSSPDGTTYVDVVLGKSAWACQPCRCLGYLEGGEVVTSGYFRR
jgi:hypothetical protein